MFTPPVRSLLYAFGLSVAVVSATPGLSLSLSGTDSVVDIENLYVSATLTNTGDTTVKILNDPSSILSPTFSTNTFDINSASGSPSFVGMKVKYNPFSVIKRNREQSFTVLSPGESVTVDHALANAYNFTGSRETSYIIAPSTLFYYVDVDTNELMTINAETVQKHTAKLSGTLAVARRELDKRIVYNSCSASEESALVSAAAAAQTYAENAQAYLDENTASTTRYTTWFGEYNPSRHAEVLGHFSNMLDHPYADYTYDCSCTDTDVYAYVYPHSFGTIYLCGGFWDAATAGTDSMGGTLIHESSHFTIIGGTDDYVYGQTSAQSLIESNPDKAIFNADNHEYFAENNPSLS
ncbi:peptidyl-Lys metalloendopeptidase [Desarmillaria ectypa]|nr:peptidyl-Lys metalloendopeptidase [Desarmillaria ectypa]